MPIDARARSAITGAIVELPVEGIVLTFAAGFFVVAGFAVVMISFSWPSYAV